MGVLQQDASLFEVLHFRPCFSTRTGNNSSLTLAISQSEQNFCNFYWRVLRLLIQEQHENILTCIFSWS
ncbi:hypothetical protein L3X38_013780 [Prunus dulcis]|uniref:Uncharacterized protein n=1 Tax=Prunus dulcis TaxID=3755 RepID=A0AAD4WLW0_PRUDU|nr:hypothetical protein L3X38_013780 [Prunus dulcis]